jgi:acetoin utilization deacetylase AcuC-like enzyme
MSEVIKTFYSLAHLEHAPAMEFEYGRLVPIPERPERAEHVRSEIELRKLGPVLVSAKFGLEPALRVHDRAFVEFLGHAHDQWIERYGADAPDAIPSAWPARGMRRNITGDIESRLGSYASDTATPIVRGTWPAAHAAVDTALSAAQCVLAGERAAFGLTRPPGHHASADTFGGYCYLNNAAIAAQWYVDHGRRAAILDVDYHHGNGTQAIFYHRPDVLYCSLHADPAFAFPHFAGFADERGTGFGEGANLNLPLPGGTDWANYAGALAVAAARLRQFSPDVLVISLGLDTSEHDPICDFLLQHEDYLRMGEEIARLDLPTLFLFEGGYNLESIGKITANVLEGFLQAG